MELFKKLRTAVAVIVVIGNCNIACVQGAAVPNKSPEGPEENKGIMSNVGDALFSEEEEQPVIVDRPTPVDSPASFSSLNSLNNALLSDSLSDSLLRGTEASSSSTSSLNASSTNASSTSSSDVAILHIEKEKAGLNAELAVNEAVLNAQMALEEKNAEIARMIADLAAAKKEKDDLDARLREQSEQAEKDKNAALNAQVTLTAKSAEIVRMIADLAAAKKEKDDLDARLRAQSRTGRRKG